MNVAQNLWGEFTDCVLEDNYCADTLAGNWQFLKKSALFFSVLFILFAILDYFIIRDRFILAVILTLRTIFLIYAVVLVTKMGEAANIRRLYIWSTAGDLILAVSFLADFGLSEQPDLLFHSLGAILTLSAYFILPNRWIYTAALSTGLIVSFFLIALRVAPTIGILEIAVVFFYLVMISAVLLAYTNRINRDNRYRYLENRQLTILASVDPLTGIHNRLKFNEELRNQINLSLRYQYDLSLIIYDYDDFKEINDRYGHLAGDQVLVDTSHLVKEAIRKVDTFARWGGEEFVILLPFTSLDDAVKLAERLRSLIAAHSFNIPERVTCSFGITSLHAGDDDRSVIHRVDQLLYEAKRQGKNVVVY